MDRNLYWTLGCVYGAAGVALGAFGAHGLKKRVADPAKIANFATAAQYQVFFDPVSFLFGLLLWVTVNGVCVLTWNLCR